MPSGLSPSRLDCSFANMDKFPSTFAVPSDFIDQSMPLSSRAKSAYPQVPTVSKATYAILLEPGGVEKTVTLFPVGSIW